MLGLPLCLNSSLGIDFQCATTARVPHEFLHNLHVLSVCHQNGGKGVAERMPPDLLSNSRARCGRSKDAGKQYIWLIRALAEGVWAREHPVISLSVQAVVLPGPELRSENQVH